MLNVEKLGVAFVAIFFCACSPHTGVAPARTSSAITPADVKMREYIIADDSMRGRAAGTIGSVMMTNYVAREMQRLGLEPGGENGTYFQTIPMIQRYTDSSSTITVSGEALKVFTDYSLIRPSTSVRFATSLAAGTYPTIYGGRLGDTTTTLSATDVNGRIMIFDAPLGTNGQPTTNVNVPAGWMITRYPGAAAIMIATTSLMSPAQQNQLRNRGGGISGPTAPVHTPLGMSISNNAAEKILGVPLASAAPGAHGKDIVVNVRFGEVPTAYPARNVIAIVRGSDPVLRNEYVQVSAHSDHLPVSPRVVDHDSLKAYNMVLRPAGSDARIGTLPQTSAETLRIQAIRDSLRKLHPPRRDSIFNGADDDGSGSTALLEIAENLASSKRPKRSVILVWHVGEESGLLGSWWLSEHTTVPHDSITAVLNMDMVGRGERSDNVNGGPRHLEVMGSRRLSTDLGNVVDSVNAADNLFDIDYSFDAKGQVQNRYCRSDHYMYARTGIPIAYISRGYHPDYHMVTDEPQYISYTGLAHVAQLVRDVAVSLANRTERVRVDKPKPDPLAPCVQ